MQQRNKIKDAGFERSLLVFGGTFDPVHLGHINTAIRVQQFFHFDQFAFLPCKIPVLDKKFLTSLSQHRLAMLNLALATQPQYYNFYVDEREITRDSPSYMVTTLKEFRKEFGEIKPITLLLGFDAFCKLPRWHQWHQLIKLTNLLIINRHGYKEITMSAPIKKLLITHETKNPTDLLTTANGLIVRFNAGHYAISSTAVRNSLILKKSLPNNLLPTAVYNYIVDNKLYTPRI